MMPDKPISKPISPFSGLDKALLRSTQAPASPSRDEPGDGEARRQAAPRAEPRKRPREEGRFARKEDSLEGSLLASYQASKLASASNALVRDIRAAVKTPGKEVSFIRLTSAEKRELADIVYTYKRQGKRTSENEINRIAINFILSDYRANGADSILSKVIDALLA